MNSRYNDSIRKEIVEKADIVSIINQYVPLQKKGSDWVGLCPFHEDSNPSMHVNPQKRIFKCFSCNTGGDVITFVSKIEKISIEEAKRKVGKTVGITFQMTRKEIERQKNDKYYKIANEAAKFYNFYLNNAEEAQEALDYINGRGLSNEILNHFNIGASGENDELFKLLQKEEFLPMDMIEVGLVKNFGNNYHDVFKNRIIFPLENLDGEIVGFSGRRYKANDETAKYINTNDTVIFKKGDILYNYHNAFDEIKNKDCVYLFEGYMDAIAAFRCGIKNCVASMGTALTINQIKAIKRLTSNIVVGYDSDGPGVMATIKAIKLLLNDGFNIKVVCIPDGKDPDEFILNHGNDALYEELAKKPINAIDFLYNYYKKFYNKDDINSAEAFKTNVYKSIKLFNSPIIKEAYIKKLGEEIDLSKETLLEDFKEFEMSYVPETTYRENQEVGYVNVKVEKQFDESQFYQNDDLYNKEIQKYLLSEKILVLVAYNEKDKCLEIVSRLNNKCVDKINRNILIGINDYYHQYAKMDEKEIMERLNDEELCQRLREILDDKTLLPDQKVDIDVYIDNIEKWQHIKVEKLIMSDSNRSLENLKALAESKKKSTKIIKTKEN